MAMLGLLVLIAEQEHEEKMKIRRDEMKLRRGLRDNLNPFIMGDEKFKRFYRMYPHVAVELIELLRPQLPYDENGVPPHLQVLAVVRFLAEGSYQKGVANDLYHPMSQPTFSKYLHVVVPVVNSHSQEYVSFPKNTDERMIMSQRFQERLGFPGVLGAIDGTLPKIFTPTDHEEAYVNRHHDHSLNVQIVSDVDYNILNLRICNGSTNDQFMWRYSGIRQEMYRLRDDPDIIRTEGRYYLIGDNGYTPSTVLLTPVIGAEEGSPEYLYSDQVRRTRCRVEQTIGIWKEIMRCINGERCLHYAPSFSAEIVTASAVLYNFLRHHGMPIPEPVDGVNLRGAPLHWHVEIHEEYPLGLFERQQIINAHFAV